MSSPSSNVHYINLLSACYYAAHAASTIIRDTLACGQNHSILNKTQDEFDPQTIADIGAQYIITSGLKTTFPGINIVGEEPETCIDDYIATYQVTSAPFLDTTLFTTTIEPTKQPPNAPFDPNTFDIQKSIQNPRLPISTSSLPPQLAQLDLSHLIIYIDPLDGTSEYTKGHKEHVTTLISITYYGHALGGVIHYPFTGATLYGGIGLGCYTSGGLNILPSLVHNQLQVIANHRFFSKLCQPWLSTYPSPQALPIPPSGPLLRRIVTSHSHVTPQLIQYFENAGISMADEVYSAGGAGNKCVLVFTGAATAYVYPCPGTKRWDIGVIDGLLTAHGGKVTGTDGAAYIYDDNCNNVNNIYGCVCTLSDDHQQYIFHSKNKL